MKYLTHLLTAAVFALAFVTARADSLFTISGQFNGGGTLTGSMMINTATGALDSGSASISGLSANLSIFNGNYAPVGGLWYADQIGVIDFVQANSLNYFEIGLPGGAIDTVTIGEPPGAGLIGYTGQSIAGTGLEASGSPIAVTLSSGEIVDPPSAAPEISTSGAAGALTLLAGLLACGLARGNRGHKHGSVNSVLT